MTGTIISSLPPGCGERMQALGMWKDSCPVPLERLLLIKIRYLDFAGKEHDDGQLVALDVAAPNIAQAFTRLLAMRFPINKIVPLDCYDGDDERSMADNNTSCFNYRLIAGKTTVSMHSYGLAIDINPEQNPMITFGEAGTASIHPLNGWSFLNRYNRKPGMIEEIVSLMAEAGFFIWGGTWTTPIDYHHFQTPRGVAELLAALPANVGEKLLSACIAQRHRLTSFPSGEKLEPLLETYRKNPSDFIDSFLLWTADHCA